MRLMVAFPGHAIATIDCAKGLENGLRAAGHEVTGFYYHARLAFYDVAIDAWKERNPGFKAGQGEKFLLASEPIAIEAIDFLPDAVIIVNGMALHQRANFLLDRLGIPLFLLCTESPYRDWEHLAFAKQGYYSGVFVNDRVSLDFMREKSGLPVCYLPHSFDPDRHYPQKVGSEYQSDVYFFGTWWPERRELLEPLKERANGYKFDIDGATLNLPKDGIPNVTNEMANVIPNDELVRHYCGAKIALNHHRTIIGVGSDGEALHVGEAYSLGPRAYEIAACGAFQLSDDKRAELRDVFGDSVATYSGAGDLAAKIEYYLTHTAEREEMAAESLERVQNCSFQRRAEEIVVPFIQSVLNKE